MASSSRKFNQTMLIDEVQDPITNFSSQLPLGDSALTNLSPKQSTILMDAEDKKLRQYVPSPKLQGSKQMRISVTKNKDGTFSPIEFMTKPGSAKNSVRSSDIFRELKAMNEEEITDSKAARLADFLEFINKAQAEGSREVL